MEAIFSMSRAFAESPHDHLSDLESGRIFLHPLWQNYEPLGDAEQEGEMIRCYFNLFSSRYIHIDPSGDEFQDVQEARRMARIILLDFAQHHFSDGEECLVACKMMTEKPKRYYLTSLALLDEAMPPIVSVASDPMSIGVADEGETAYRMSADWTDMHELRSDGFLKTVGTTDRSWFLNYIPREEHPRVAAAINHAIQHRAPFALEHKVIRADSSIGWTVSRALPVVDERGQITQWIGVATDVTARH